MPSLFGSAILNARRSVWSRFHGRAYLTDEWLRAHGVRDVDALLQRLRPEDHVMRPDVLRTIKAPRFSFARSLLVAHDAAAVAHRAQPHRYR